MFVLYILGFDLEGDDSSTTTTTYTIGQQYHDNTTKEDRTRAEELLLELIELKEEGEKYHWTWVVYCRPKKYSG